MIERYSLPDMAAIWSEEHRLELWQRIETLVAAAWAVEGVIPEVAAAAIAAAPPIDPTSWKAREDETRHDVAAFVDVLAGACGEHGRWVHYGLTSSDILDTSLGVQMKEAATLLLEKLVALFNSLQRLAIEHRDTVMVGRTHGIWAEPTTFGHKLAGFGFETARAYRRLEFATHSIAYGKISGPVGTHSTVPASVEESVLGGLGLHAEPAATQVVGRDRHAAFLSTLAGVGASLERFATEIRHLQRSEVGEVSEPFTETQKGSSAMPHKHNPILSENVVGMARLLRGYAATGLENVALWHERDISHSSVERVILPDASFALDFALTRMTQLMDGLIVDPARMQTNLEASYGTVFSQSALLELIRRGADRDEAYRLVQAASTDAMHSRRHLREVLAGRVSAEAFSQDHYVVAAGASVDHLARITVEWLGEISPLPATGDSPPARGETRDRLSNGG